MNVLSLVCLILPAVSIGFLVAHVLDVPRLELRAHGPRGLARRKARESQFFRLIEPLVVLLAAHVAALRIPRHRSRLERAILAAGEFHGFGANEVIALSGLFGLAGIAAGSYIWSSSGGLLMPLVCIVVGPLLPMMRLSGHAKERCKSVDRGLPAAIDLAALCMNAGLDFPGAISHVVENMADQKSPVRQELERIMQELSLGRTRQQALQSLSERVDTDAVREFAAAVVQAEEKGSRLATVLSIQATALRGRRSVLAEEAAARAGVMLMLPMLMMMGSISLILMGPLLIDMMKGGLM